MDGLWFNGWQPLLRIIVVGICSYIALIVLLRSAGKRTLSRMNAYDMVITMALGSILGKVLLSPELSISESVMAMFLLVGLQYSMSEAMCRFRWVRKIISARPSILYHDGDYNRTAMRRERVDKDEVEAAMHEKCIGDITAVDLVILENNGELSVLPKRKTAKD